MWEFNVFSWEIPQGSENYILNIASERHIHAQHTHRHTHTHTWIDIVNHGYVVLWFSLNYWHVWSLQMCFGPCWTCRIVAYQCITVPSVDQIPSISETHCYTEGMFHDSCLQKENWIKNHYDTMSAVNVSKDDCWHCCIFGWQREGTRLSHGDIYFLELCSCSLMGFKSKSLRMPVIFKCSLHDVNLLYIAHCMLCLWYLWFFYAYVHPFYWSDEHAKLHLQAGDPKGNLHLLLAFFGASIQNHHHHHHHHHQHHHHHHHHHHQNHHQHQHQHQYHQHQQQQQDNNDDNHHPEHLNLNCI